MRRMVAGGLVVAGWTVFGGWTQVARAEVGDVGGVVTDYDAYPAALPENCPEGAGALSGVRFTDGAGQSTDDLHALALRGGETITMSWDGAVGGCAAPDGQPAVAVTLAAHAVQNTDRFDEREDQPLLTWVSCGDGGQPCEQVGGRYQLALALPSGAVACAAQVDALLGPPLGMVGPSGSYYTSALRGGEGPTLLVAAGMARATVCAEVSSPPETPPNTPPPPGDFTTPPRPPADTSTPPANPDTGPAPGPVPDTTPVVGPEVTAQVGSENASAPLGQATPALDQTVVPTTPAAATTPASVAPAPASVAPALVTGGSPAAVQAPAALPAATSVLGITASRADLPTTGARTDELVLAAAACIACGAILSVLGSRRERDRALAA